MPESLIPGFDFVTAPRIVFGAGRLQELGALCAPYGSRACLVTGARALEQSGRLAALEAQLTAAGVTPQRVTVSGEPTVECVDALTEEARRAGSEMVIAIGGGSVLDAGKAIAALLANPGQAVDYLEGVGNGARLERCALPFIAVPTTAGTGSELSKNAVLGNEAKTFKKSMRSDSMMAQLALVDPDLLEACPPRLAAACGMDALVQLLESYTSPRATPITRALCEQGLALAPALVDLAAGCGANPAREAMAMASMLGGVCLANAGLGAVHGLASPLGAHFEIPHGVVCALLVPHVVRLNLKRARGTELACDYAMAMHLLESEDTPRPESLDDRDLHAQAERLVLHLATMVESFGLGGLGDYGIAREDFPRIVAGGRGNSMRTNPVELSDDDLTAILEAAL